MHSVNKDLCSQYHFLDLCCWKGEKELFVLFIAEEIVALLRGKNTLWMVLIESITSVNAVDATLVIKFFSKRQAGEYRIAMNDTSTSSEIHRKLVQVLK